MSLTLITAPAALPVSLAELKAHCRVDSSDFDTYLTQLLNAAVRHVEEICWRALITQTWKLTLESFPGGDDPIVLPRGMTQSVSSVTYQATDGTVTTLGSSLYVVSTNSEPGVIVPAYGTFWPTCRTFFDSVQVQFVCGFGATSASVPNDLRTAVMLMAGWMYEGIENDVALGGTDTIRSRTLKSLLAPWKLRDDRIAEVVR